MWGKVSTRMTELHHRIRAFLTYFYASIRTMIKHLAASGLYLIAISFPVAAAQFQSGNWTGGPLEGHPDGGCIMMTQIKEGMFLSVYANSQETFQLGIYYEEWDLGSRGDPGIALYFDETEAKLSGVEARNAKLLLLHSAGVEEQGFEPQLVNSNIMEITSSTYGISIKVDLVGSQKAIAKLWDCVGNAGPSDQKQNETSKKDDADSAYSYPRTNSCSGWSGTVTAIGGRDTAFATMEGHVTKENLREFCERDPGGETIAYGGKLTIEECINKYFSEEGETTLSSSASCNEGKVEFESRKPGQPVMTETHLFKGVEEKGGCAEWKTTLYDQFKLLCPKAASTIVFR